MISQGKFVKTYTGHCINRISNSLSGGAHKSAELDDEVPRFETTRSMLEGYLILHLIYEIRDDKE